MAAKIFIQKDGQTLGPMSPADLQKLAQSGKLLPEDLVWQQGSEKKVRAKQVKGLSFKKSQAELPKQKIFIQRGSQTRGPVSPADLQKLAQSGKLLPEDLVWQQGRENKVPAKQVKGLSFKTPQADLSNLLQEIDTSPVKDRVPDRAPGSKPKLKKPKLPMVSLPQAIQRGLQNSWTFDGRATRAEYWWWILFVNLLCAPLYVIPLAGAGFSFLLSFPTIAVTTRRLHDIGRTGWWQVLIVAPALICLVLLVLAVIAALGAGGDFSAVIATMFFWIVITLIVSVGSAIWWTIWLVLQGDTGPNIYGPDPRRNRQL